MAKAELELSYGDSDKRRHDVRIAKADAAYAIANEKCDSLANDAKVTCIQEAKARYGQS